MSQPTFDHSTTTLEEKLARYWELTDQREALLTLIAKAKNEKESVNERVFKRVMADYERSLQTVSGNLDPLKQEMDALRQETDQEVRQVDAAAAELEDEIAEADFRHRVGEYDDRQFAQVSERLLPRLNDITKRRSELYARLSAMDRRRTPRDDALPKSDPSPKEGLENPQEWADELEPARAPREAAAKRPTTATAAPAAAPAAGKLDLDDDPLAALSDPSPAMENPRPAPSGPEVAAPQSQSRSSVAAPSYPNLVIRSGPHAGKIVPLLPMTMNIGREHDNNIELKDPEVARYHARILYEGGRFHIEDLGSSSGTWVNGEGQKRRPLSEGDVIRIGETELVMEFAV